MRTIKGYVSTGYVSSAKREFTFEVEDIEEAFNEEMWNYIERKLK